MSDMRQTMPLPLWRVWVEGIAIGGEVVYRDTVRLRANTQSEAERLAIGDLLETGCGER